MSVNLSPLAGAGWQFFDNNGNVLTSGKLYTYLAGTGTAQTTYASSTAGTANANPIILNAAGRTSSEVWLTDGVSYKFILKDSTDTQIGSWGNITGFISAVAASGDADLIGYTQGGTGAVATTVQAKLRSTVSVKDFGAVGDGIEDDTDAIQAAVDSGNIVEFPNGSYKFGKITKSSGSLIVNGNGSTFLTVPNSNTTSQQFFELSGLSEVRLSDFTLNGGFGTSTSIVSGATNEDDAISADNCGIVNIDNVVVTGWSSGNSPIVADSHAIFTRSCDRVVVSNCQLKYISKEGIHDLNSSIVQFLNNSTYRVGYSSFSFSGTASVLVQGNNTLETGVNSNNVSLLPFNRSSGVVIQGNVFRTHGSSFTTPYDSSYGAPGLVFHNDATATPLSNIVIVDNVFDKMRYGIYDQITNANKTGVTISGNKFSQCYECVKMTTSRLFNLIVSNNSFESVRRGVYVIDAVGCGHTYIGNLFSDLQSIGLKFVGDSTGAISSKIIVANNIAINCTSYSYQLQYLGDSSIQGNLAVSGSNSIIYHYEVWAKASNVVTQNNIANGTVTTAPYYIHGTASYLITRFNVGYGSHNIGAFVSGSGWNESSSNGCALRLGNYRLWVDSTGDLRIKNGAATSDTDGTVVGTQV